MLDTAYHPRGSLGVTVEGVPDRATADQSGLPASGATRRLEGRNRRVIWVLPDGPRGLAGRSALRRCRYGQYVSVHLPEAG
jgi:hypothetical protein